MNLAIELTDAPKRKKCLLQTHAWNVILGLQIVLSCLLAKEIKEERNIE